MRTFTSIIMGCALFMGSVQISSAQEMVKDNHIMMEATGPMKSSLKKAEINAWYNFINGSSDFGVTYTRITNATLFPDTLVYQLYGAEGGGTQLAKTSTHSIGQVFDPKDSYVFFDDPINISRFNPYVFDSLAFTYRYAHNVPGSVDTVLIQFYNNDKVNKVTLSGDARPTATVGYDKAKNKGLATSEIRVFLTADDVTDWSDNTDYGVIQVAVPGGMNVSEDGVVAATVTYIPGFDYSEGDTVEFDWSTPPTKQLNHMIVGRYHDNSKLLKDFPSYNTGLMASSGSRYTTTTWPNRYIPGAAWFDYDQQYYFLFHIIAQKVSVPELGANVNIYPNPSLNTPTVIEGELAGTTLRVLDITGREVISSIVLDQHNEIELMNPGTYILQFEKDGVSYSKKLVKY